MSLSVWDERHLDLWVYTFREGVAARFGHDLKMRAHKLSANVRQQDDGYLVVEARIRADTLAVECVRDGDKDVPDRLSARDMKTIDRHMLQDVLRVKDYPEIAFVSERFLPSATQFSLPGQLSLVGQQRRIQLDVRRSNERITARTRLHQPDFGIKPFSAPLGVIKVKADVVVEAVLSPALFQAGVASPPR